MKEKAFPCGRSLILEEQQDELYKKEQGSRKSFAVQKFFGKRKNKRKKEQTDRKAVCEREGVCSDAVLLNSRRDNERKGLPEWKVFDFKEQQDEKTVIAGDYYEF